MIPAVMPTYAREDIAFVSGEGAYLVDDRGRRYLDFGSGIAVTSLGHCHPHLVEALQGQAGALWHTSNLYRIPGQELLAQRLVDASFADSVFFCNSGAEAVEAGLKTVRKYHDAAGNPERYRVITFEGCFHGRTLATLASAKKEVHMAGFHPMPEGFDQVAFGNLNELKAAITGETAAILVEPVQGEGGIRPADAQFLKALRATADEYGLLVFFDEVQTGSGRTGKLFAHEWAGVEPDVLAVAKGLGGGFPIGALLTSERATALVPGSHGTTFGGNPLAVACANAVLDVMLADGFFDGVNAQAAKLWKRTEEIVAAHPKLFSGVRGMGMMIGLQCVVPNTEIVAKLTAGGLLTVPAADNVLRFLPPLIIGDAEINEAMSIFAKSCDELETGEDQ